MPFQQLSYFHQIRSIFYFFAGCTTDATAGFPGVFPFVATQGLCQP